MSTLTDVAITQRHGRDFVIGPYCQDSLTPLGYDLRIGFGVGLRRDGTLVEPDTTGDNPTLHVPPQGYAFIVSKEFVWLGRQVIGTLHARGSLSARGLFINATTVDPNWRGRMTFLVFNTTQQDIELPVGERFITLILHLASQPTSTRPQSNPQSVVHYYGKHYGERFENMLLSYITSKATHAEEQEFNLRVDAATRIGISEILRNAAFNLASTTRSALATWNNRLGSVALATAVFTVFGVPYYWESINDYFYDIPYDSKVFAAQFAATVTLVLTGLGLLKRN